MVRDDYIYTARECTAVCVRVCVIIVRVRVLNTMCTTLIFIAFPTAPAKLDEPTRGRRALAHTPSLDGGP